MKYLTSLSRKRKRAIHKTITSVVATDCSSSAPISGHPSSRSVRPQCSWVVPPRGVRYSQLPKRANVLSIDIASREWALEASLLSDKYAIHTRIGYWVSIVVQVHYCILNTLWTHQLWFSRVVATVSAQIPASWVCAFSSVRRSGFAPAYAEIS